MRRRPTSSNSRSRFLTTYQPLEPRRLLAGNILVGNLNSGVAVSDNATGTGFVMYSQADVHARFSGVPASNSDHFIATRLDGIQWQYNNDSNWIDFAPVDSDLLVADVNFDGDTISRQAVNAIPRYRGVRKRFDLDYASIIETIDSGFIGEDLRFAANRFGGAVDVGEFQVLGSSFSRFDGFDEMSASETKLQQIGTAALHYESVLDKFPRPFSVSSDGSALLSWRVHLLPFLGLENLYAQFNLDEPWNSANNLPLASQMPDVFASPHFSSPNETSYLAVTGSNTMFPYFGYQATFGSILDGAPSTLMFVEGDASESVVWTSPVDLEFDPANPLAGLGSISPDGFAAFTADGTSHTIPSTIGSGNFANMAIRNDGNVVDFSEFSPYSSSEDSLRQIVLAAHRYENAHMKLPSHAIYSADETTPLLSWRVKILPFLGHNNLYNQFHTDEPWNSAHNLSLLPLMPHLYAHPSVANGMTNYLGVSGPGTIFELSDTSATWGSLIDGSSNTVMFVEANADQAIEWTKPQDWLVDPANSKAGLGDLLGDSFNTAFADGTKRNVDLAIDEANFAKMLTTAGQEVADFSLVEDAYDTVLQLRNLALAALNFESAHMHFPKHGTYGQSGTPLLSWRVELLEFTEHNALYSMFHHDEPWDSPHNLSLLPLMPDIYRTEGVPNGFTVIQGANGPDTMFPLADEELNFQDIGDGASNTALFMQVDSDRAIEWTKPLDLPFDASNPGDGLGGALASGFHFVTADGSAQFYNSALDVENLEYILQRNDGVPFDSEWVEGVTAINSQYVTRYKLQRLSNGALDYENDHMRFPAHAIYSPNSASGTPMLSWRVEILPFIGHNALYELFHLDEPWDSPHNLSLIPLMPDVFSHPSVENGRTVFQTVTTPLNPGGTESIFPIYYRGSSLGSIYDSYSNTFMFVEANADQAVEWTKPDDIMFDPDDPKFGFGNSYFGIGSHVSGPYGISNFLESCLSEETYTAGIMKNDGSSISVFDQNCDAGIPSTIAKSGIVYGDDEATDKKPLLPGETATFENYSSYVHGITKVSVDIGRLEDYWSIDEDDFVLQVGNGNNESDFTPLGVTPSVDVSPRGGDNESVRVTLEFPNGSVTNTWLQVTVLANETTGLTEPHVFYFGNAIGETGDSSADARVNLLDVALTRANQTGFTSAAIDNPYDIDRDGRVDLIDVSLVRANQSGFTSLNLITAPGGSSNRSSNLSSGGNKGSSNDSDQAVIDNRNFEAGDMVFDDSKDICARRDWRTFYTTGFIVPPSLNDEVMQGPRQQTIDQVFEREADTFRIAAFENVTGFENDVEDVGKKPTA